MFGFFTSKKSASLGEVMRNHAEKGTKIELSTVKKWTIEILQVLDKLHEKKLAHWDIRPENLFIDALDRLKVGDLDVPMLLMDHLTMEDENAHKATSYHSPELTRGTADEKSDIW
jgi:serine/threonine protein kinase